MAETGCRRVDSGGRIGLPGHLGSGELSLVDPMGPPPLVDRAKGDWPEVTPDRLGLSSPTLRGRVLMRDPAKDTALRFLAPAGVSSEINPGWNKVDGGMEDFCSIGGPGDRTLQCAHASDWEDLLRWREEILLCS
jgi:hypothetical protein